MINIEKAVVHPVTRELHSVGRLGLGDFILMMGEDQILSAGVNINRVAQIALGHAGALDVPAGTPLTPGRIPVRLALLLGLPEDKIQRVPLELAGHLDIPVTALQILNILMGQLAIGGKGPGLVIDRPVLDRVGIALIDEIGYHMDHLADFPGRPGMDAGRPDI